MFKISMKVFVLAAFMAAFVAGCSSEPTQAPEAFVKDFMTKHVTMVDESLVGFYVPEETAGIKEQVTAAVAENKGQGTLEAMQSAKLDLSHLEIKVLEEKTDTYNDQAYTFLKINVTGTYTITMGEETKEISENETFVLRAEGKGWKVTDRNNPWS